MRAYMATLGALLLAWMFYTVPEPVVIKEPTEVVVVTVTVQEPQEDHWEEFKATGDYALLQKILYLEARGEPEEGQIEVLRVILNRVASSEFPDTVEGVLYQKKQFSPVHLMAELELEPTYLEDLIHRALMEEDHGEALFFVNGALADPGNYSWFSNLEFIESIGNHEFYK